jgi:hypothetical protein
MEVFVKCMVWPGEVFWPQEAGFFSSIHKNHSWVLIPTVPDFIDINPMV